MTFRDETVRILYIERYIPHVLKNRLFMNKKLQICMTPIGLRRDSENSKAQRIGIRNPKSSCLPQKFQEPEKSVKIVNIPLKRCFD